MIERRPWSRTTGVVRAIGRGKVGARSWPIGSCRSGGLERGARRVIGCQAQPALLLGRERCRRCDRAAAMLARDGRAAPCAIGGGEVGTDAGHRASGDRTGRDGGGQVAHLRFERGHRVKDSRDRLERPAAVGRRRDPPETQKSRRRPIFPKGCPLSIFGAGELNFRVRDGNGCGLSARVTGIFRVWIVSAAARRTIAMIARGAGMVFDIRVVSGI